MRGQGGRNMPKGERAKAAPAKTSAPTKKSSSKKVPLDGPLTKPDESCSYNVRRIANGYVVSESRYDAKRGYISRDTFTPTKPSITITPAPKKP